jgi:hypothetical protein
MQVILDTDEAATMMSAVTSNIIDNSGISQDAKRAIRNWRGERALGSVQMADLTEAINEALGTLGEENTTRIVRRRGQYSTTRDVAARRPGRKEAK